MKEKRMGLGRENKEEKEEKGMKRNEKGRK